MITRKYKLAANFNTVEIEFDQDELMTIVEPENGDLELVGEEYELKLTEEEMIQRLLQREYDILSSIKCVESSVKDAAPVVKLASPKQCEWAKSLGMKNPEKRSSKEVWTFINEHKKG